MFSSLYVISFLLIGFISLFRKKLILLIFLEVAMLNSIILILHSSLSGLSSFSFMIYFLCFLVLDSVLVLTLFVGCSRTSNTHPSAFFSLNF